MINRPRALASIVVLAIAACAAGPSAAETLQEALALAYRTNPTLLLQRSDQRALDEIIVQARAGLRPAISVTAEGAFSRIDSPLGTNSGYNSSVDIGLSQILYSGGRIGHGIAAAEAFILAGRENLRAVEQEVLAGVIQAYADVIRDMEVLQIRQENNLVLQRQLYDTTSRFEVGEITRTDVAQSEARLSQSETDLANAQAQLSLSRAAYATVVGQAPGDLAAMPALPGVPRDFEQALDVALVENPAIRAAGYSLQAAEANVAAAKAENRPSARLAASFGGTNDEFGQIGNLVENTRLLAGVSVSVPLSTGGLNTSRVAEALERANGAQINVERQRRNTLQSISSAFTQALSARSTLRSSAETIRAATVATNGVREEADVGLRTTLDVLNQELELRNAQVVFAGARRNEYVAEANLLAAMGRLGGPDLDPTLIAYDSAANYERVRDTGAVPWEEVIESLDRIHEPRVVPAEDAPDAPIDQQLKPESARPTPEEG